MKAATEEFEHVRLDVEACFFAYLSQLY